MAKKEKLDKVTVNQEQSDEQIFGKVVVEEDEQGMQNELELDTNAQVEDVYTPIQNDVKEVVTASRAKEVKPSDNLVNCLRKERVIVRHINRPNDWVKDQRHVLYGGMAENASRTYCCPQLSSGVYVNVLTKEEKEFLEHILGLEYNALSVYKKENNFWDSGLNKTAEVKLNKQDVFLDLSDPNDYIRYKILLANKDFICPSLMELQTFPKVTYEYVLIHEGEEVKRAKLNMSYIQMAYKEFGKIEDDIVTLRVIIQNLLGRPLEKNVKLDWLQTQANELIQLNPKQFVQVITDPKLPMKVIISRAVEAGILAYRANQLFVTAGNIPLCELGQESTLNNAVAFLENPRHQDVLYTIQDKLEQ